MSRFALIVVINIASVVYAAYANAWPITRTYTLLPPDTSIPGVSTFRAPDMTLSSRTGEFLTRFIAPSKTSPQSRVDISSGDFISSDAATTSLHDHQPLDSVEHRDPSFSDLTIRNPTGSPLPPITPYPSSRWTEMLRDRTQATECKNIVEEAKYLTAEFVITHSFLSLLPQKDNPLVQSVIAQAERVEQSPDALSSRYWKVPKEAAVRLLELYKKIDSFKHKALTSREIQLVEEFTDQLESRRLQSHNLDHSIAQMMTYKTQLWNYVAEHLPHGDPRYIQARRGDGTALLMAYAFYLKNDDSFPIAKEAARNFLRVVAESDRTLLPPIASGQGKKRKADADSDQGANPPPAKKRRTQ
ncbi:hypothetical protein H0H93_013349 [Arthromyces matolae]|nr:hypothetical protein H0H93_013349 [Arthromyces matolae]